MSSGRHISVTVRLYSILRQRDGQIVNRLELELPAGSQIADVLSLLNVPRNLELVLAINDQIVAESAMLQDQDLLRIIPAIAGGEIN